MMQEVKKRGNEGLRGASPAIHDAERLAGETDASHL